MVIPLKHEMRGVTLRRTIPQVATACAGEVHGSSWSERSLQEALKMAFEIVLMSRGVIVEVWLVQQLVLET